ncbi:hypothetical protein [Octadecabacter sp. R77987]|uniref:hypothetical protein n=1 Tax=Octadecabacter sp. R77987 TaxID=3093874 RepID=UPI00366BFD37
MARVTKPPVFLARASYRQRRLRDAARLLPVVAGVLMMLPLLWPRADGSGQPTSVVLIYLFVLWVVVIGLALLLSRLIDPDHEPGATNVEDLR